MITCTYCGGTVFFEGPHGGRVERMSEKTYNLLTLFAIQGFKQKKKEV